jgi:hypothetical protein
MNALHTLHDRLDPASLGRLQRQLLGLRRARGGQYQPLEAAGKGDARRHLPSAWAPNPGRDPWPRDPDAGETGLSADEVKFAMQRGLL